MKKYIIFILGLFLLFQYTGAFAQMCNPTGEIDVIGDGIKEKIYNELVSRGASEIRKIIIIKDGKNIFPEEFPRLEPFIARNGMTMRTYYGSFGGYAIGKFDRFAGKQVLIYCPSNKEYIVKKESNIRKIYIKANLFRYNQTKNVFEYYRDDCIYYTTDNKPGSKENIIKMFESETNFIKAFRQAEKFLKLLREERYEEAKKMGSQRWHERLNYLERGQLDGYKIHTWNYETRIFGFCFYDRKNPTLAISINPDMPIGKQITDFGLNR